MECEWDPEKATSNARKHGVRFADAVTALEDEHGVTVRDAGEGEERWVTIGMNDAGRLLTVVFTWRGDRVRIISARRASPRELRIYEER